MLSVRDYYIGINLLYYGYIFYLEEVFVILWDDCVCFLIFML